MAKAEAPSLGFNSESFWGSNRRRPGSIIPLRKYGNGTTILSLDTIFVLGGEAPVHDC